MSLKPKTKAKSLFPQILDSHHQHYHLVHISHLSVRVLADELLAVSSHCAQWTIRRSDDDLRRFDVLVHTCLTERLYSQLPQWEERAQYCRRLNRLLNEERALVGLKCVLILNWLECDHVGRHLIDAQDSEVNRRAIGAALVVREWRFTDASNRAFLRLESEDVLSILEINGFWTKGKKGVQVGLFPSDCVRLIDESVAKALPRVCHSPLLVRRLSSLFPHFFQKAVPNERPERGLNLSHVLRPRVFARDLAEQLFESGEDVPPVLRACSQFIESEGLVDGIYRLSGVASNISRLREQFDAGLSPSLTEESVRADIHCVSSCLKLFFRLLPNPLLTFEAYDEFVASVRDPDDTRRLHAIRRLVRRLPPPHFRTVRALMRHLRRVSQSAATTGMTEKNLSIVWAPNLLRSRDIEMGCAGGDLAALQVIGIQAVLTEYLIQKFSQIFDDNQQTTDDNTPIVRFGCFGRQLSQRVAKKSSKKAVIRWKSFDSFFNKKDFFSDFRINFAKIQTFVDLMRVSAEWQRKPFLSTTVWTTTAIARCVPLVTTTTGSHCVVVNDRSGCVRDDAVVVKQNVTARERIERIKAQRRQQLKQQFLKDESKPVPVPRKTRLTPVPTPRRTRDAQEIRILTTSARNRRNNWNENAIQMLNKR